MFNSKSYYTEEDAILANVEADLSYDGADGLCRAIMESYENERLVESLMDKADAMESRMLSESASEEDIQSLQEASVKSVVQYIIGIMQRFWAKLKGMVMRFIHKVQLWWTKRKIVKGMKDAAKEEKRLEKVGVGMSSSTSANKTKKLINLKGSKTLNELITLKPLSDCKVFKDFIEDTGTVTRTVGDKENSDAKPEITAKDFDSDEELADALTQFLCRDNSLSYDSLKDDLYDLYFDEDDVDLTKDKVDQAKANLAEIQKKYKDLQNIAKDGGKYTKKICSMANKAKASDNAYYLKALNKAIRIANNVYFRVTNVIFGLYLKYLNSQYAFYRAGIASAVTITLK